MFSLQLLFSPEWFAWTSEALLLRTEQDRPDEQPLFELTQQGLRFDKERYLKPSLDDEQLIIFLGVGLGLSLSSQLFINLSMDTGALRLDGEPSSNGRSLTEEVKETALLREASLEFFPPLPLSLRMGRLPLKLGRGLIYEEMGTGTELQIDWEPLSLLAGAWLPGRDLEPRSEPLIGLRLSWSDGLSELGLFFVTAQADETAEQLLERQILIRLSRLELGRFLERQAWLERCAVLQGNMDLWYLGGYGELLFSRGQFRVIGLLGGGSGDWQIQSQEGCRSLPEGQGRGNFEVESFAFKADWRLRLREGLYGSLNLIWMSGGGIDESKTLSSYVAPAPYLREPLLFFGGGMGSGWERRDAELAGVNGYGVWAPGLKFLLVPNSQLEISILLSDLRAEVSNPRGQAHYGTELDFRLAYLADDWNLQLEFAALEPGNFYPEGGPWWSLGLSLQLNQRHSKAENE